MRERHGAPGVVFGVDVDGNHYHLVVECTRADLSEEMRWLNGVYAERINRRHGRYGHLFLRPLRRTRDPSEGQYAAAIVYVLHNTVLAVSAPIRTSTAGAAS